MQYELQNIIEVWKLWSVEILEDVKSANKLLKLHVWKIKPGPNHSQLIIKDVIGITQVVRKYLEINKPTWWSKASNKNKRSRVQDEIRTVEEE